MSLYIAPMKIDLVNYMGGDLTTVNCARVSFGKHAKNLSEHDLRLIKYLAKHDHFTPFTHSSITFRAKVPIFIARQWFKHTVGFSYNEMSRRYVDDEPELYDILDTWRKRPDKSIKQGSSDEYVDLESDETQDDILTHMLGGIDMYNYLIESGVCPEQARCVLPQNVMTEFIVTGSLAAWARFYKLRSDSHAQEEIRWCANQIDKKISSLPQFTHSWVALKENYNG